jgi:hypothetical protein
METNWKILNLKRKTETSLVTEVTYVINFDLNGEKDRKIGTVKLEGDPTNPDFIPFEELDEQTVLVWVKDSIGTEEIEKIENEFKSRLENRLENRNKNEFSKGLPWSKNKFTKND